MAWKSDAGLIVAGVPGVVIVPVLSPIVMFCILSGVAGISVPAAFLNCCQPLGVVSSPKVNSFLIPCPLFVKPEVGAVLETTLAALILFAAFYNRLEPK